MKQTEIEDMELLVEKLEGIISVKFIADNDGELEEIHVLSDKVKSPKQLSRDIQSAISAYFATYGVKAAKKVAMCIN